MTILLAVVAMALTDAFGTFLTVAEARGRAILAGACDAAGDVTGKFLLPVYGAGVVIKHGWTPHAILTVGCVMGVSFLGTAYWTRLARRIRGAPTPHKTEEVVALQRRLANLEARLLLLETR